MRGMQGGIHVDRALRFVATFASERPSGEASDAFVEVRLGFTFCCPE